MTSDKHLCNCQRSLCRNVHVDLIASLVAYLPEHSRLQFKQTLQLLDDTKLRSNVTTPLRTSVKLSSALDQHLDLSVESFAHRISRGFGCLQYIWRKVM